jgi:hypothetical protein
MSRVVVAIDPSGTPGPGRAAQNDVNRKTAAFEVRHMRSLGKTPAISRPTRAGRPTRQKILLHSRRLASSALDRNSLCRISGQATRSCPGRPTPSQRGRWQAFRARSRSSRPGKASVDHFHPGRRSHSGGWFRESRSSPEIGSMTWCRSANLANFLRTLALPPTPSPSRISIGHFPFRVAQLRDARARRYGKLGRCAVELHFLVNALRA